MVLYLWLVCYKHFTQMYGNGTKASIATLTVTFVKHSTPCLCENGHFTEMYGNGYILVKEVLWGIGLFSQCCVETMPLNVCTS